MKITPKQTERLIIEVAGDDVLPLVKYLKNKKNISEFVLADDLKCEINCIRNMLYRLYHANLVSFNRKKDKKKGWYIYYWTFMPTKIIDLMERVRRQKIRNLRNRLDREKGEQFFRCKNTCIRLNFFSAMNFDFKCPECGNLMEHENNQDKIRKIELEIQKLEKARKAK